MSGRGRQFVLGAGVSKSCWLNRIWRSRKLLIYWATRSVGYSTRAHGGSAKPRRYYACACLREYRKLGESGLAAWQKNSSCDNPWIFPLCKLLTLTDSGFRPKASLR